MKINEKNLEQTVRKLTMKDLLALYEATTFINVSLKREFFKRLDYSLKYNMQPLDSYFLDLIK